MRNILFLTVLVVIVLATLPLSAAAIISNGSFENTSGTDPILPVNWTVAVAPADLLLVYVGNNADLSTTAPDGTQFMVFGSTNDATVSQAVSDNPGQSYTLSFYMRAWGGDPSTFGVLWNGSALDSWTNPDTSSNWVQFSYSVQGTGNDTISFVGNDSTTYILLDNVSLDPVGDSSTPEPGSLALLAAGLVVVGLRLRRRRA